MTGSDQSSDCYLAALRLLTGRDYTCAALRRKLQQKRFAAEEAHQAVERLMREGYLQDQRYAERLVAAVRQNGSFTGYRLQQELRRRGVPPELIDQVLRESPADGDELDRARHLVERRYAGFDPQTADERQLRRVAGFLQRRGYRSDLIRQLFEK